MTEQSPETPTQVTPSAGEGNEQTIPKYRFDEMVAKNKALEEANRFQTEALQQLKPQPQAQHVPALTAEQLGIEDETFAAIQKMNAQALKATVDPLTREFEGHLVNLANQNESLQFQLNHGKENAKHSTRIKEYQNRHFQQFGTHLDMDSAFKLMKYDEITAKSSNAPVVPVTPAAPAAPVVPVAAAPVAPVAPAVPDPSATQSNTGSAAPATPVAPATAPGQSLEDMEAQFDAAVPPGGF